MTSGASISMRYGLQGPNETIVTACAASTHAIGYAARLVAWGMCDAMVTGGSEACITLTGVAGFIGAHVARALLDRGDSVVGIDNLNAYYPPALKHARLAGVIGPRPGFRFVAADFADTTALAAAVGDTPLDGIIHLGAQAGVRHSIEAPNEPLQLVETRPGASPGEGNPSQG
jgi:hypothetical protein